MKVLGALGVSAPRVSRAYQSDHNTEGNIMNKITKFVAGVVITLGAVAAYPAQAHADETIGQVAREICVRLDANPTVDNLEAIVQEMLIRYTEESENQAMYAAMHYVCPDHIDLAIEAAKRAINNYKQTYT